MVETIRRADSFGAPASIPATNEPGSLVNGNGNGAHVPPLDGAVPATAPINIDPDAMRKMVALPFPDGPRYDVMLPTDLGMRSSEIYRRLWARVIAMREVEGAGEYGMLSDDQEAEITELEIRMAMIAVPDAPPAELRALNERQRANLLTVFFTGMGITTESRALIQRAAQLTASRNATANTPAPPPAPLGPLPKPARRKTAPMKNAKTITSSRG